LASYRAWNEGHVDEGWKDTVLVMPGERMRLLMCFADYPGMFLYHWPQSGTRGHGHDAEFSGQGVTIGRKRHG
jgi:hypothetical protein